MSSALTSKEHNTNTSPQNSLNWGERVPLHPPALGIILPRCPWVEVVFPHDIDFVLTPERSEKKGLLDRGYFRGTRQVGSNIFRSVYLCHLVLEHSSDEQLIKVSPPHLIIISSNCVRHRPCPLCDK